MMKLKTNKTLTKKSRKEIKIKRIRTKLKKKWQIVIEWLNWKQAKLLHNGQKQKLEIKRMRTKIEI
jgi:hypothetical protein